MAERLSKEVAEILELGRKALPGPWSCKVLRDYRLSPHDSDTPYIYGPNDSSVMMGLWPIHGPKPEDTAEAERQTFATIELVAALRNLITNHGPELLQALSSRSAALEEALREIANLPDEDDEWDGTEKFHKAREISRNAWPRFEDLLGDEPQVISKKPALLPCDLVIGKLTFHKGVKMERVQEAIRALTQGEQNAAPPQDVEVSPSSPHWNHDRPSELSSLKEKK